MRFSGNDHYGLSHAAFSADELAAIQREVLVSPLLGGNRLSSSFDGTRGFSLVFTRAQLHRVAEEFAYLATFLERVLRPACNAFYLNPLLMCHGTAVAPHVDCTLAPYLGGALRPALVSVLYVEVPDDLVGGALVLCDGDREVGRVTPRPGTLLYFVGRLQHYVTTVETASARLSLVCEQYKLTPETLGRVPAFEVQRGLGNLEV